MIASGVRSSRSQRMRTILVQSRSAAAWMQPSAMTLDLTPDDAQRLRQLLEDYLPDLRREEARTEEKTLRHELVLREELLERIVSHLGTT